MAECCIYSRIETNADRIRAMSDEELAVTLMCPNEMGMAEIPCDHSDSCNCCKWLTQFHRRKPQDFGIVIWKVFLMFRVWVVSVRRNRTQENTLKCTTVSLTE